MDVTKNDLCFNEVTLDYQALLQVAEVAFSHCKEEIREQLRKLDYPRKSCYYLNAGWLLREAKFLSVAAETLYTLENGLSREELKVVNKPETKEED